MYIAEVVDSNPPGPFLLIMVKYGIELSSFYEVVRQKPLAMLMSYPPVCPTSNSEIVNWILIQSRKQLK